MIKVEQQLAGLDLQVMMIAIFSKMQIFDEFMYNRNENKEFYRIKERKKQKKSHVIFISFPDDKLMNQIFNILLMLHKFSPSIHSAQKFEN